MNRLKIYTFFKEITPPFLFKAVKNSRSYPALKRYASRVFKKTYDPAWHKIQAGPLKGREIYITGSEAWRPVINGRYDDFFLDYLKKLDLQGKTVFDIGAHIGFNSLVFGEMVGPTGKVLAFEPNPYNKERLELILHKNPDLAARTRVLDIAVSNQKGESQFVFSDNIEGGTSSGSFLANADTHMEKSVYEREIGFKRVMVKTVSLDSLKEIGIEDIPYMIKIDVEGAEYLVLEGGMSFIASHRPILLIEIHSIFNMLRVAGSLEILGYRTELLKEEPDGRCFIAGRARP